MPRGGGDDGDDYYAVLGVSRAEVDGPSLKRAYRKLAMRWHPDKHASKSEEEKEAASENFKRVAEAYAVLSNPEKRRIYDMCGAEGLKGMHGDSGASEGEFSMRIDPNELFAQFFRGFGKSIGIPFASSSSPFGLGRREKRQVVADLWCTLEELYVGTTKRMRIRRTRLPRDEEKSAEESPRILEIDVLPGWKAGTRITFESEGDEISPGVFQDVVFVLKIKEHPRFAPQGSNLIHNCKVPLVDALTHFDFSVEMLDGSNLSFRIPGVVTPQMSKVVPKRGMPKSRRPGQYGDLIITFEIVFPLTIDEGTKEKLRGILPRM